MTTLESHYFQRRFKGFTIVELLVATAVTALLVALMLQIATNILGAWSRSSGTLTANSQARTALDELTRDLQAVIYRRDANVWLTATVQSDQNNAGESTMTGADWSGSVLKPKGSESLDLRASRQNLVMQGQIADARFGQAGMWLRMITTPSDENNEKSDFSAPRAVSYQLVRRKQGTETASENRIHVYQLFRSEVRPGSDNTNDTFSVGYDLLMSSSEAISYNKGDKSKQKNAGNIRSPYTTDIIANNVIDFGIWFYDEKGVRMFPTADPDTSDKRGLAATAKVGALPIVYGYPSYADVMMRILTEEGARMIQSLEDRPLTVASSDWWEMAEKNSIVFTRRIRIPASGF